MPIQNYYFKTFFIGKPKVRYGIPMNKLGFSLPAGGHCCRLSASLCWGPRMCTLYLESGRRFFKRLAKQGHIRDCEEPGSQAAREEPVSEGSPGGPGSQGRAR